MIGRFWPSRGSAGVDLLAVKRTFSKDGGFFACGNWMTTLTGRFWPGLAGQLNRMQPVGVAGPLQRRPFKCNAYGIAGEGSRRFAADGR